MSIVCRSAAEIEKLARVNALVARVLKELAAAVRPGVTTKELDELAEKRLREAGALPAFKGYHGYPATICASVNEQVVHGIPGLRRLKSGDNVSIDIGAVINGYYGDAAITVPVGEVDDDVAKLIKVTEASLNKGLEQAVAGNKLSDISHAVQVEAEAHGYGVVRDYVGHGIGRNMHEDPQIPNYGPPGRGPRLKPGMTLAIEPMINLGTYGVRTLDDGWTVVTTDGKRSAHFEHTVVVTENGPEVLTKL